MILVVDQRVDNLAPPTVGEIRQLGNKETGPGFDQLMWVGPASSDAEIASYRVFNSDGSEVEQCGNGVRCVARYLAGTDGHAREFALRSPAGLVDARVYEDGRVAVSMGVPQFEPDKVPFVASELEPTYQLSVANEIVDVSVVSMGNPHCVLQVDDVSHARVTELGPAIEYHERFPSLTNVGFMHASGPDIIELRVHERGVGETKACGTGACAAVVSGQRLGLLDEDVRVRLPGGEVVVSWRGGDVPVWLTGNAEPIKHGTMYLEQ